MNYSLYFEKYISQFKLNSKKFIKHIRKEISEKFKVSKNLAKYRSENKFC